MSLKGFRLFAKVNCTSNIRENKDRNSKPGGQTAIRAKPSADGFPITQRVQTLEFKFFSSTEGIVLDGYFSNTYELDSLAGHPGIKY